MDLSATLDRIVARLDITSTDDVPDNLSSARITLSKGGATFNPITGLSTSDSGFDYLITGITPAASGKAQLRAWLFLSTDEQAAAPPFP